MSVIINETCGGDDSSTKNTGGKKQCLEGAVRTYILSKSKFKFDSLADAKSNAKWDEAKTNKDIVVFYDIEELEPNNTENQIKNGRYSDYKIKDAIKGVNYTHYLSTCSHEAVKSYENSDYNRVFRVTDNNELLCEVNEDGSVQGEPLKSFIVGIREDAPADGVPSTKVQLKFDSYPLSIIKPDFDLTDYEGIYDVKLSQDSATATSIKVKVSSGCSGTEIDSLESDDFIVRDASGAVQTVSFVPPVNGVYEFTGTGFANGFTVEVNGVVVQTNIMYEGGKPLVIAAI
ncbi:hypothetical protein [Aquimarina macrocephali]|uniref:hypothetical protein n=1 Tax=Aquimarina macrocephali TaxID=666563 RepID=UPI003F66A9C4